MAPLIYLDTHVAAWLFSDRIDLLPAGVRTRLEQSDLLISPAVKLELQYLYEIRRITSSGEEVVKTLEKEVSLQSVTFLFSRWLTPPSRPRGRGTPSTA